MSKASFIRRPGIAHKTCAVCGKKHGPTFNFKRTLAFHAIKGEEATVECIRQLARKRKR
jgi:hypothetical protein